MKPFGPFTLTQDQSQDVPLDLTPVVDVLVVKNASPFVLEIQSYQGGMHKILPFWADLIAAPDFQGTLTVLPTAGLSSANPPMQSLLVDAYQRGEQVLGSYPAPLAYQFNLGNNVPLNAQATSVANDGNLAGTSVVEGKPTGASSSQLSIDNTGKALFVAGLQTGTPSPGANPPLPNLILNSNNGANNCNIAPDNPPGIAATYTLYAWDGSVYQPCINLKSNGAIALHTGAQFSGLSRFSGTVTGTYNHGLGATPTWCGPMQSVVGSQTMGFDAPNGTTVHVTSGAGNTFSCLCANI